jgi:hypothetical protein
VIHYALICEAGHEFESWFQNSAESERQLERGLVDCPVCSSRKVSKAVMAPAIQASNRKRSKEAVDKRQPVALLSEKEQEARKLLKALREHVTKNAENVGDQFPKLARQMHHEEIESRSIYGNAKFDEVRSLLEEGVEVQPLPILPDEHN